MPRRLRHGLLPLGTTLLFLACGRRAADEVQLPSDSGAGVTSSDEDSGPGAPLDATVVLDASPLPDATSVPVDAGGNEDASAAAPDSSVSSDGGVEACAPLGTGVTTLAANQGTPYTLATGGGYVFWTTLGGNVVRATPDGCSVVALASGQAEPVGIAVDDANAYFTSGGQGGGDGGLYSVPIDGGGVATLAMHLTDPYMVAHFGSVTYWTSDVQGTGSIWAFANGVAAPFALGQNYPGGIVALGSGVYWGTYDGTVIRAPLDGGALATIASGETTPRFFATDGENVVWADTDDGLVVQMNEDGGAPIVLASGQANPNGVATDGVNVYFTTFGTAGSGVPGELYRVAVGAGAAPVKLADGSGALGLVAVDGANVYWVDGSAVMRLSPK